MLTYNGIYTHTHTRTPINTIEQEQIYFSNLSSQSQLLTFLFQYFCSFSVLFELAGPNQLFIKHNGSLLSLPKEGLYWREQKY